MSEVDTTTKRGFWEFKKYKEHEWFRFLVILLSSIVAIYIITHLFAAEDSRYEYEKLGKEELQQINRIYFDTSNTGNQGMGSLAADVDSVTATRDKLRDARLSDSNKCIRVLNYVDNQFNNKVDSIQIKKISSYLCTAKPLEAISFLSNVRFRLRSCFWLVGPAVYFEIIFWAMFGVIASLLFSLGVVGRNSTTDTNNPQSVFDSSEIPYQFAKLWYAPLCTLIIVLGYNFFSEDKIVDISSSKGVIVFAFIGGFYSSRLISFLDRLKEVLLPNSNTVELPNQKHPKAEMVNNTSIELQLDDTTIPAEIRNDIAEMGLSEASVVLENKENAEVIPAVKTAEDQSSTFTVANIKPGTYIIKAAWSGEVNTEPVNLVGELEETIKASDKKINIILKKADSEG